MSVVCTTLQRQSVFRYSSYLGTVIFQSQGFFYLCPYAFCFIFRKSVHSLQLYSNRIHFHRFQIQVQPVMLNHPVAEHLPQDIAAELCQRGIDEQVLLENIKSIDPLLYSKLTHQKNIRIKQRKMHFNPGLFQL